MSMSSVITFAHFINKLFFLLNLISPHLGLISTFYEMFLWNRCTLKKYLFFNVLSDIAENIGLLANFEKESEVKGIFELGHKLILWCDWKVGFHQV